MMRSEHRRRLTSPGRFLGAVLLGAAALLASCRGGDTATLADLAGVQQLKEEFNREVGRARVILLLSPT